MTEATGGRDMFLEQLFTPFQVGTLRLRNRLVMPAMGIRLSEENGSVNDRVIDYYAARAKGGVGLIVVGCCVVREGRTGGVLSIGSDDRILGLADLAESIHEWGAAAIAQLFDAGMAVDATGQVVARGVDAFSTEEIEQTIDSFAAAAVRARAAGYDGVEIHGAHGYLISQFLSPLTNHRKDEYGGDLNRRAALPLAIVRRIRDKTGSGYPISFRLNGSDYIEGGLTLTEARVVAQLLEKAGTSVLHVSAGKRPESFEWGVQPMAMARGCLVPLAQAIKESVRLPVIAVGRINDPVLANQVLAEKKADLVAMGRALLADPEMPRKAFEQRFADIRKCIACMVCHQRNWAGRRPRCAVNAAVGREAKSEINRAETPKTILIAGSGPAGLEAARVLALRGHRVTLWEKSNQLGGQARLAARPPHKEEVTELVGYLTLQIQKLGVKVKLEQEIDAKTVIRARPDAVVIATGGRPGVPRVKGIERAKVHTAQAVVEADGGGNLGNRIVVIGGGLVGCETAELLAAKGKNVTLVEETPQLMEKGEIHPFVRKLLIERLAGLGVTVYTGSSVREVRADVIILAQPSGSLTELPCDSVVLATGSQADTSLADELRRAGLEVYAIGECTGRDGIMAAIHDGFRIGRLL